MGRPKGGTNQHRSCGKTPFVAGREEEILELKLIIAEQKIEIERLKNKRWRRDIEKSIRNHKKHIRHCSSGIVCVRDGVYRNFCKHTGPQ